MHRIHIVGGKNHGKTTLIVELVEEFRLRGMRVGTIKHTHHQHELDTPGKDSHRHREAGAAVVGIISRSMNAVFWPNLENAESEDDSQTSSNQSYESFAPFFSNCDLVLVEGDTQANGLKLEVWRAEFGTPPMSAELMEVCAIVTDDSIKSSLPILTRTNVETVADFITITLKNSAE